MDPEPSPGLWRLGAVLALVIANGFFVAAEFAIVKVRSTRLQELADGGSTRAKLAVRVNKRLDSYLSACQLGITIASLGLGWVGEPALAHLLQSPLEAVLGSSASLVGSHAIATGIAFTLITFLHTVVGELAPKSLAIAKPELTTLWSVGPLHVFHVISYPVIVVLNGTANMLLRTVGLPPATGHEGAHSEEELRLIFEASARGGILSESTKDLLTNIVDYTERVAREVMTPRARVDVLDARRTWEDNIKHAIAGEWTRYPVVETERGKIIGFVHIKDLFKASNDPQATRDLRSLVRQPLIVPESMPLDRLRRRIQATRTQMALVHDEFGTFVGVVTLEDCLEEIVGEIQDETDQESPPIVRDDQSGSTEVDGAVLLDDVEQELGLEIPEDERGDVDTVGGFVFARLGRPPALGDVVEFGRFRLVVTGVDGLRVAKLRITELPPVPENGESQAAGK